MSEHVRALAVAALVVLCPAAQAVEVGVVPNTGSDSVSFIDVGTDTVLATVPIGNRPISAAIHPDGTTAWVANSNDENVVVVDVATQSIVDTLVLPEPPVVIAVAPDGRTLYVADGRGQVRFYDTATNALIRAPTAGSFRINDLLVSPDGTEVYAIGDSSDYVTVIDTKTGARTGFIGVRDPTSGALTPDGATLYVASFFRLYEIDLTAKTVTRTVSFSTSGDLAIHPSGSPLYLTDGGDGLLRVIDPVTLSEIATAPIPNDPSGIEASADGTHLYVTDVATDAVTVLDTVSLTAVATLAVGDSPRGKGDFLGGCPGPAGDCDGDGTADLTDNCLILDNPGQENADGDAHGDACDNCPAAVNDGQEDGDRNGIGDACQDVDGDGVIDVADNCVIVSNPGQEDGDGDGRGDACDICPGFDDAIDTDGDKDPDGCDNCPTVPNPGQQDTGGTSAGDHCEDRDGDGRLDAHDNCADVPNPNQENADRDAFGDACDDCTDQDRDGFGDPGVVGNVCPDDNCPSIRNPLQTDADADGIGDDCMICAAMDGAARFAFVGREGVKWKPGAAYYNRYPTVPSLEGDVCGRKVVGVAGYVDYDVVATEPVKRAVTLKDKGGYSPEYIYVSGVITGGGSTAIAPYTADFIDETGTHPEVALCQEAMDDALAASQYFASLPPDIVIDKLILRPGESHELDVGSGRVIEIGTLVVDGKDGRYGCRDYAELLLHGDTNVIVNVTKKFRLGDCGSIDNYWYDLNPVIINVVGPGPGVKIGPSAWAEVGILAPERSLKVKGAKNFEEPTFIEPVWAKKLKVLGYVCAGTQLYDGYSGDGYCGVEPDYAEEQTP